MKRRPDIREWIVKAEQDYETAETMARKRKTPVPDIVGFHSQQCIEKYLKAFLVVNNSGFHKTHDLIELLETALEKDPLLETLRSDLRLLNPFSVQFRYPGDSATEDDARLALKTMRSLRDFFRKKMNLK
jgi:HEPN domain-containing protein